MARKVTKIQYKKLRKAWGYAYIDQNRIELYHKLKGKNHLKILLHEKFHLLLPDYDEKSIRRIAKDFSDMLWKEGYRRY